MKTRQQVVDHYMTRASASTLQKSAASATHGFHGAELGVGVVVRSDLNGYSKWARDHDIPARVQLLDDMFSFVVPALEQRGGVYYRDEGDCIVSLFTPYFSPHATFQDIRDFCKVITSRTYGRDNLTLKSCVAVGQLAIFQKAHEQGSEDWTAEGPPFVAAARLEAAVDSKPRVTFFASDYNTHFAATAVPVSSGERFHWSIERERLQVPGMGFDGGWTEIVYLEYDESGRLAA